MTWDIAVGIFALCAFALSLITLAGKIIKPISELSGEIKLLHKSIEDLAESNSRELERVNRCLSDHETRIRGMEKAGNTVLREENAV